MSTWRNTISIPFGASDNILTYLENPALTYRIWSLWENARTLLCRYASQEAYHQALFRDFSDSAGEEMKVPRDTPWTAPIEADAQHLQPEENSTDEEPTERVAEPETFIEPSEEAPEEIIRDSRSVAAEGSYGLDKKGAVDPATVSKAVIKERPASKRSGVYAISSSLLDISEYPIFFVSFFPRPQHFSPLLVPLRPTYSSPSSTPRSSLHSFIGRRLTFLHSAWLPPEDLSRLTTALINTYVSDARQARKAGDLGDGYRKVRASSLRTFLRLVFLLVWHAGDGRRP
ncbi:hypothetical protein B0H19DRAFT_1274686 [Mycena capillaripes]|nr:hypothetical protein B0H19DRAFT_1274686 [Mycena capillaripes]